MLMNWQLTSIKILAVSISVFKIQKIDFFGAPTFDHSKILYE